MQPSLQELDMCLTPKCPPGWTTKLRGVRIITLDKPGDLVRITPEAVQQSIHALVMAQKNHEQKGCPCVQPSDLSRHTLQQVGSKVQALCKLMQSNAVENRPMTLCLVKQRLRELTDILDRATNDFRHAVAMACVCHVTDVD